MGVEERINKAGRMSVLKSVQGHDNSVVHAFNHTDGRCPMCGFQQQAMMFCAPDEAGMPKVRGCELDGRHLHRLCGACHYPWIERCLDQAMLSEAAGELVAESEISAALAAFADRAGGLSLDRALVAGYRGWLLRFERDPHAGTLSITAAKPPAQAGKAVHPEMPEPGQTGGA